MTTAEVLTWLRRHGSQKNIDGMARYAITAEKAFGVSMATMKGLARQLRGQHALALELWETKWYEARILAALIDDPVQVTARQMDHWSRDFDNWAICDTACLHLFDKTPHAWAKVPAWARSPHEFVRRGAFALMASLALHDKAAPDAKFLPMLPLIERAATDPRNFVKKGVAWALRGIGSRSPLLHERSLTLAEKLAQSASPSARWIGKEALRDLSRPLVKNRVSKKQAAS
jgi:3-methyladenine DNA glycosylase AlkD